MAAELVERVSYDGTMGHDRDLAMARTKYIAAVARLDADSVDARTREDHPGRKPRVPRCHQRAPELGQNAP
jgi:hypothetical protein